MVERRKSMGAFDSEAQVDEQVQTTGSRAGTIEIHGQGETDYVIIARICTDEDESWVLNRLLNIIVKQGRKRISEAEQLKLADSLWLQRLIVSWTLPIPLDPDRAKAIKSLSQS